MKRVLTIAGSDCSGGAGIQADLKTMVAHGVYGMSAITALTAQNTLGVTDVMEASPEFVTAQLERIFEDIRPDAVKIGMVASVPLIEAIARSLMRHGAEHVVVDPVMVATSGSSLLASGAVDALRTHLFPLAEVITPNLTEAEALLGYEVKSLAEMERGAEELSQSLGGWVVIKGGHLVDQADDLLWRKGERHWYQAARVDNPNTHGTGCTLSSAIACNLALGMDVPTAFARAKRYVTAALESQLNLGRGNGPLNHGFAIGAQGWEAPRG